MVPHTVRAVLAPAYKRPWQEVLISLVETPNDTVWPYRVYAEWDGRANNDNTGCRDLDQGIKMFRCWRYMYTGVGNEPEWPF